MGPFEAIVVLIIVGFLMLAAEVFVPGMVLGLLGGVCLAGAITVAFVYYNVVTGSIVFAGVCLLTFTGFVAWLAVFPRTAIVLCECLATSDLPGGVVNVLTGKATEIAPHLAKHREVSGIDAWTADTALRQALEREGSESVKRVKTRAPLTMSAWLM